MATGCETERGGLQISSHARYRQSPGQAKTPIQRVTVEGGVGVVEWVGSDLTAHLNLLSLVTSSLDTNLDKSCRDKSSHPTDNRNKCSI